MIREVHGVMSSDTHARRVSVVERSDAFVFLDLGSYNDASLSPEAARYLGLKLLYLARKIERRVE